MREQVGKLQHTTTIYLHPTIAEFGKKLAEHMPEDSGLSVSYFTNSGSEATEVAILSAREYTGNSEVISLRNGYHGGTQAAMGLTAHGSWKFKSSPVVNVKHATPGYCYRCPYGLTYPSCDVKCARDVEELIRYETPGEVACFIAEPIQGVGGVVTPPPEYFGIVYDIVRKHGGLCIADEVQTGFGRTGDRISGASRTGASHPTSSRWPRGSATAIPAREPAPPGPRSPANMRNRVHFNTFGGNPDLDDPGARHPRSHRRRRHSEATPAVVGGHLKSRLARTAWSRHPLIGDVRGMGLMLGVELVRDRVSKEPANTEAIDVLEAVQGAGLAPGRQGRPLRQRPPDQAADVHHPRRRRLPGRRPGRGPDPGRVPGLIRPFPINPPSTSRTMPDPRWDVLAEILITHSTRLQAGEDAAGRVLRPGGRAPCPASWSSKAARRGAFTPWSRPRDARIVRELVRNASEAADEGVIGDVASCTG